MLMLNKIPENVFTNASISSKLTNESNKLECLSLEIFSNLNVMFESKTGACPSEAPFGPPLWDKLLALSINIRLGWKGLPGTNTQADYKQFCKFWV
jgi:hypothetical protein